jgi:hypothetical protein
VFERGRDRAGRLCAVRRVLAKVRGRSVRRRVRSVTFRFDGRRVKRDRRWPFSAIVYQGRRGRGRVHRVVAVVRVARGGKRVLRRRVRSCPRG